MLSQLLARLGFTPTADDASTALPAGWGMRGSLRGSTSNADRRTVVDYRSPAPISVGTLQAIETNAGRGQVPNAQTRVGSLSPYNGSRFSGDLGSLQHFVGSSLLLSAANGPALNRRTGLPSTQPMPGQPLGLMQSLLLQSDGYDTSATGLLGSVSAA